MIGIEGLVSFANSTTISFFYGHAAVELIKVEALDGRAEWSGVEWSGVEPVQNKNFGHGSIFINIKSLSTFYNEATKRERKSGEPVRPSVRPCVCVLAQGQVLYLYSVCVQ